MDTQQPLAPKVILGVVAHPDDLDFGASGTIAHFVDSGVKVYYLILTDGQKGTADQQLSPEELVQQRKNEQQAAAKILGVSDVAFLDYEDGALEVSMNLKKDIVRHIRQIKPDVLITMDPSMLYSAERGFINHPDHRAAGQAALDAVYPLARDHLSFPDLQKEGLQPHKVATVLLINFEKQNYYVDITTTIDKKLAAIAAHSSQVAGTNGPQDMIKQIAAATGRHTGSQYAEGFLRIDVRP